MIRPALAGVLAVLLGPLWLSALTAAARPPAPCEAPPTSWVRGFNFTSWWHDGYVTDATGRSFGALAETGVNAIALIATQYQPTPEAASVAADPWRTPSDDALRGAIARARAAGMVVRLRILVDVASGGSRLDIAPADPDAWFAAYRARVVHYAALAERAGAHALEIGAELRRLTGPASAARWRALIAVARGIFRGRISYGANWDEYRHIAWWDALDEIAIDAYLPLALAASPSEDAVVAAWSHFVDGSGVEHRYLDEIEAVAERFGRPVVFSELGYPSTEGALVAPWRAGTRYSAGEQDTGLVAALRALARRPWFAGVYVWHWNSDPLAGGAGDLDHTVQGKPAEDTVREWFTARRPVDCGDAP